MSVKIKKFSTYALLVIIIWVTYYILQLTSLIILSDNIEMNYCLGLSLLISLFSLPFFLIWLGLFFLFQYIFFKSCIGLFRFSLLPEVIAVILSSFTLAFFAFHNEMGFLLGINYAGNHPTSWSELWEEVKKNNFGLLILMICSILFIILYQNMFKKFSES